MLGRQREGGREFVRCMQIVCGARGLAHKDCFGKGCICLDTHGWGISSSIHLPLAPLCISLSTVAPVHHALVIPTGATAAAGHHIEHHSPLQLAL